MQTAQEIKEIWRTRDTRTILEWHLLSGKNNLLDALDEAWDLKKDPSHKWDRAYSERVVKLLNDIERVMGEIRKSSRFLKKR